MNNAKYVMVAEEYLPENAVVKEIRIEYKNAAVLGDRMIPRVTLADDSVTVVLVDENGKAYATVLFLL
jgi:acyl-ACP thioesterase